MAARFKFDAPYHLYPFEHRFAELGNGIEMHYVDEGEGETLLMLHGNLSWSFLYRKMILRLREHFRCVAPDYPGFGLTETLLGYGFTPREYSESIERFADKLGLRDMTRAEGCRRRGRRCDSEVDKGLTSHRASCADTGMSARPANTTQLRITTHHRAELHISYSLSRVGPPPTGGVFWRWRSSL